MTKEERQMATTDKLVSDARDDGALSWNKFGCCRLMCEEKLALSGDAETLKSAHVIFADTSPEFILPVQ